MIDEKKLIEELESLYVTVNGIKSEKGISREYAKHYKQSVLRIIDEQPKVGEWIPCSDRLPEDGETYLVTNAESFGQYHTYKAWYDGKQKTWHMDGNFEIKMNVIAWMPLPEPYIPNTDTAKKTNADRIRSMTDDELADFIERFGTFNQPCNISKGKTLEWLQSEVEDNEDE